MTDVLPWFFVKYGSSPRREQGDVLTNVYNPFAIAAGRVTASLPRRPSPEALVQTAAGTQRGRLRNELLTSGASTIFTFGEEARRVVARIVESAAGPTTAPLNRENYGEAGEAVVDARAFVWHALVHPGQRSPQWIRAHGLWTGTRGT